MNVADAVYALIVDSLTAYINLDTRKSRHEGRRAAASLCEHERKDTA